VSENFREKIERSGAEFRKYNEAIQFKTTRDITNIYNTGKEMLQVLWYCLRTAETKDNSCNVALRLPSRS